MFRELGIREDGLSGDDLIFGIAVRSYFRFCTTSYPSLFLLKTNQGFFFGLTKTKVVSRTQITTNVIFACTWKFKIKLFITFR